MSSCLFCKIIAGEIPSQMIYEDDHAFAFLDIKPSSPGHMVVIPKEHAPTILVLDDANLGPLFAAVKKMDEWLVKALDPDGISIGINQGRASGQEVDHLHVHLMPRWHSDGGHAVQSVVDNEPKETLEEMRKKILGVNVKQAR